MRTLAENRRLAYLPEISALFDELKDEAEGVVDVTVTSAAPLDDRPAARRWPRRWSSKLEARRSACTAQTDPALIGGAVLRAGDLVIDGSLRTRLDRIAYELTA